MSGAMREAMRAGGCTPIRRALAAERYDVVALRLLLGLLVALEESAPAAREALIDELMGDGRRWGGRP